MLKKILSAICLWAILGSAITLPAYAATINEAIIKSFDLTVANSTPQTFNPSAGQILQPVIAYDTTKTATSNGYVRVIQGSTIIKTLATWTSPAAVVPAVAWDGSSVDNGVTLCGVARSICPNGDYQIEAEVDYTSGTDTHQDKQIKNFTITSAPSTVSITSFDLTLDPLISGGTFDPSSKGGNQDLTIKYTLSQTADSVMVEIISPQDNVIKTFASNKISDTFVWDGMLGGKLVLPGDYTAKITATKSGTTAVTSSKTTTVAYPNSNKGAVSSFTVSPSTFNATFEDTIIQFTNTLDTFVTVEIVNPSDNTVVRTFTDYEDDEYGSNTINSIPWDGTDSNGSSVPTGTYKAVVTLRNEYGVVTASQNVSISNSAASTVSSENTHISGISFSPSYTFDPAKNDQLKITYDIKQKLDSLKIYAMRGNEKIELGNETNIEKENNVEVDWDGTNENGDNVDAGSWKIQFESRVGSQSLIAAQTINVAYTKPKISDVYVSKAKFDNEQNEFTYIFFRTDIAADVTVQLLLDNNQQDNIVEDMAVDGNKWYAVSWDGSGYSYSDNLDFKVLAQNTVNHNVYDSKKVNIDLAEDVVSSTKSNITQDYMDPVVSDGNQDMQLFYNTSANADVNVTIYRGNNSTSTTVATILDVSNQDSGDHVVTWDGRDNNGNLLSKGIYTYKITATTTTADTETGIFVIGNVGDVEGGVSSSGSSSSSSSTSNGSTKVDGVIIDGKTTGGNSNSGSGSTTSKVCAGFTDVTTKNQYCPAVQWVKDQGIFKGYNDGSFGVNQPIARAELLKVIMEALGIKTQNVVGNLGFTDATPGDWYMPYLQAGKNLGIMNGDSGQTTVRPYGSSQRVEALKMIFESMKSAGTLPQINNKCTASHSDVLVNSWYGKYVCEADTLGLYDSDTSGYFGVSTLSTRGEIAEILYRLHTQNLL